MLQPAGRFVKTALHHLAQIQPGGVDADGVGRRPQRRNGSIGVVLVAPLLVGEHFVERDLDALLRQLRVPPRVISHG